MPCRAMQNGLVIVESSGKMWFTGGGNDNPLQYSCRENPMNNMKRQKDMTLEDDPPQGWKVFKYATREEQRTIAHSSRKNVATGPKEKQHSEMNVSQWLR